MAGAAAAKEMPFPGLLYSELLSGQNLIVYFAAALVPLSAWIFYRTRFGLRLRAVGENPHAVDTAGISVNGLRYQAVIISGVLCGVAGTYLSTAASSGFVRDMTAGKGYLALAALIFGKWKPVPTLFACLLFAFTDALATRLQGVALPVVGVIPVQFILALPYVLTVLLLAGFVGKAVAPRAIGVPYSKENEFRRQRSVSPGPTPCAETRCDTGIVCGGKRHRGGRCGARTFEQRFLRRGVAR